MCVRQVDVVYIHVGAVMSLVVDRSGMKWKERERKRALRLRLCIMICPLHTYYTLVLPRYITTFFSSLSPVPSLV